MIKSENIRIFAVSSSATAPAECQGHVIVSGSYGGEYNAWHAAKNGIRGVVLNDAGVGFNNAGTNGLPYLDRVGIPAATADTMSCHIGDGEHMLEHGVISFVNEAAAAMGFGPGDSVREVAEGMRAAPVGTKELPEIAMGGKRFSFDGPKGAPAITGLDAAPMLEDADTGSIVITGSHAALFRGKPDNVVPQQLAAIFFNDAGVGLNGAGVNRLPTLDERGIISGAVSATSAPIGNATAIYEQGVIYHLNQTGFDAGGAIGMRLKAFVQLIAERLSH